DTHCSVCLSLVTMPHRSCSVEINNNSGCFTLTNPRVFTESGHCEVPPPPMVGPCSMGSAMFNKTTGAATGAVGVFTYDLFNTNYNECSKVLAVMFSVPYDRNLYSNWCAVGVFERGTECDYNLYDTMYNNSDNNFVRGQGDGSSVTYEGEILMASASMSENGEAFSSEQLLLPLVQSR
uniref:DELTA-sagatoxin-Srs1a n=1 Tax=Periophthalmus magnuspinnatus TaxID=409849 RepID=A0A3B3Z739_9GOBI